MASGFTIRTVSWAESADELLVVRREVFVVEQGVAEEREVDELDPLSLHVLACDEEGCPVGTARLLPCGRIGRVAVLSPWRRRGVGGALMQAVMAAAEKRGEKRIHLHAQVHSIPFYESLGFRVCGGEFDEEGIPHREMERFPGA